LAVLPTFIAGPDLRAGRLKPVLPEYKVFEESALYAVYLPHRHVAAKVRAFVDFCAQRFGPRPQWDQQLDLAKLARAR
jgi:DNA-binding transcriptional LysR family regulator